MIGQTVRLQIIVQAGSTLAKDLVPFFKQIVDKIDANLIRRFQSAKICGKLPDGSSRSALVVGDRADEQLEYVNEEEDYKIKTVGDFQKLFVVTDSSSDAPAVIVIQF